MSTSEKRKPRLVVARDEVGVSRQPPPNPPEYEPIDVWPPPKEWKRSHERQPARLLAVSVAMLAILVIALFLYIRPPTAILTLTTTVTTTVTTTEYGHISLNASKVVLGSTIEIVGHIANKQDKKIKIEIYDMNGKKHRSFDLQINGSFRLVGLTSGVYIIKINLDDKKVIYETNLTILKPTITLSKNEAHVDDYVTVFGFNFNLPQPITICIDRNNNTQCDPGEYKDSILADQHGFLSYKLKIPPISKGNYTILASDGRNNASATFSVKPHLQLNSTVVKKDKRLNITGYGFDANQSLTIQVVNEKQLLQNEVRTNQDGSFTLTLDYSVLCKSGYGPYAVKVSQENIEPVYYTCETT
ncbi:MAG: T9SS type A sorting domain-containing protein [Thermofilaceae archaeon]